MRLLFALALFSLVPAPSAAQTSAVHAPQNPVRFALVGDHCPRTTSMYAWDRSQSVQPQKLTELPDANAYATVFRRIGGCEVPVVVRYGVSGGR
jgi:hypothetical protein